MPAFRDQGFIGPVTVMTQSEAVAVARRLEAPGPPPVTWSKGLAASRRVLYDLATRPAILDPVGEILGGHVVLWGASVVSSPPGHIHPPHVDIETSDPAARAVTVWIALENSGRESGMHFVTRSHRFGHPVQRAAADAGRRRGEFGEAEVLEWATARDEQSHVVVPDVADGQAVWFDGHLWHGSVNTSAHTRLALLLQYASADTPVRIPDFSILDWPFRFFEVPRPPCLVVSGEADLATNLIVPPPPPVAATEPLLGAFARSIAVPLERDPASGFRPHHQFRAATSNVQLLGCHVSTLDPGTSPHPPHTHDEEEILVVLSGAAEITYDDVGSRHIHRVGPGDVSYYPAGRAHTLRGLGSAPVEYLMLKWVGAPRSGGAMLDAGIHHSAALLPAGDSGFRAATLFEGTTAYLARLHSHVSVLEPGAGYDGHHDAHDVAIVVLEGTLESLGAAVTAPAVLFTSGGHPHGIKNSGAVAARYVVFEFHGNAPEAVAVPPGSAGPAPAATPPPQQSAVSPVRRARVAVWNWGGRVTRRFPRAQRVLRRLLGALSPWR